MAKTCFRIHTDRMQGRWVGFGATAVVGLLVAALVGHFYVAAYGTGNPESERAAAWTQTVPGKKWFTILRLYGPLETWFDKSWVPGEIEPLDVG